MGVNFRKKVLIQTIESKECKNCKKHFGKEDNFCMICGEKLKPVSIKMYANMGKSGITSYSYVFPGGRTMNSKGKMTFNVGNGISFTTDVFK